MASISQQAVESWYGSASWAERDAMELMTDYSRPGRLQFNSLSGGQPVTSLSFKFNKTNTGGGGTLKFYATENANLLPTELGSMTYLGEMPAFGAGTGLKTLTVPASMFEVMSQFTGTWYLVMTCSVYVTFDGAVGTNRPIFEGAHADGSWYVSDGGVMKIGTPYVSDGGVMKLGVAWVSDGGVMKQGIQ